MPSAKKSIELTVDKESIEASVRPHYLLVDVLRNQCGRTSVKEGCESASCGACTVLIDGRPALSCITLAVDAVGCEIQTVEGLSGPDNALHPLQKAFVDNHAIQCGFCTPGMLMTSVALLARNPTPTEADIRDAISGHMCRCTGYASIVRAIGEAAKAMKTGEARRLRETV
jgi:aerobic carbon-monoxide dehydrogenase small subunit